MSIIWGKLAGIESGRAITYVNNGDGIQDSDKRVCVISNSHLNYSKHLESCFKKGLMGILEGDQIVSFHNDMQSILNMTNTNDIIQAVYSSDTVKKWAGTIVYIMLKATEPTIIQQNPSGKEYLKTFLDTINHTVAINDNLIKGLGSADDINILTLSGDVSKLIGCYSNKYYLIPMTEISHSTDKDYKKFINNDNIKKLGVIYDYCSQMLIKACSNNLDTQSYPALRVVQLVVDSQINIRISDGLTPLNALNPDGSRMYPFNFNLYAITNSVNTNELLTKNLFVIKIRQNKVDTYFSTYPFTEALKNSIESGSASISQISLKMSGTNEYMFSCEYQATVTIGGVAQTLKCSLTKKYDYNNTYIIDKMPTFCMFPNMPLEVEDYWNDYTYLQDSQHSLMNPDNLQNNNMVVNIAGFEGLVFKPINDVNNDCGIFTAKTSKVMHFIEPKIKYRDDNTSNLDGGGYIINLDGEEPLLKVDAPAMNISMEVSKKPTFTNDLWAYIDFGSSSSCIQLKLEGHTDNLPNEGISKNLVRRVLAKYEPLYKNVININTENIDFSKFMSISAVRSSVLNDFEAYIQAWAPMITINKKQAVANATLIDDISPSPSNKTNLSIDGASENLISSPKIIIHNLIYTIMVNAVAHKCKQVTIVPSLPNKNYQSKMTSAYDNAIQLYKTKIDVPGFDVYNALNFDSDSKIQYLYESLVGTNALQLRNQLLINVDIGDGTTDFSAVYFDNEPNPQKYMCGYSSIEYAGKNILKTVFYNIIFNSNLDDKTGDKKFKMLMGDSTGNFQPFFNFHNYINKEECEKIKKNICEINKSNYETYFDLFFNQYGLNISQSMDVKISSNLAMRYVILMPVVLDFISVARKNLELIPGVTFSEPLDVQINFCGGASKGIEDLKTISTMFNKIAQYFENALSKQGLKLTTIQCSKMDSKELIITGLSSGALTITTQPGNLVKLAVNGIKPIDLSINTTQLGYANTRGLNSNFKVLSESSTATNSNKSLLQNPSTHFVGNRELEDSILGDFVKYFRKEIFEKLINNGDGNVDPIEELFGLFIPSKDSFMQYASCKEMRDYITDQLKVFSFDTNKTIFGKVVTSDIYPEMMKNAMFMFVMSDLLTKYHNGFDSAGTYTMSSVAGADIMKLAPYNFGVNQNPDGKIDCKEDNTYGQDSTLE